MNSIRLEHCFTHCDRFFDNTNRLILVRDARSSIRQTQDLPQCSPMRTHTYPHIRTKANVLLCLHDCVTCTVAAIKMHVVDGK